MSTEVQTTGFAARLRELCVGCRLSKKRWGVNKSLDRDHKQQAATMFGAATRQLTASKKLIDTADERYRAVSQILSRVAEEWKLRTLPYPQDGLRLLRRDRVDGFERMVAGHQTELDHAVAALNSAYGSLLAQSQISLGSLFNLNDYPRTLEGMFSILVEYPSVEPDASLLQVSAGLYERERQGIAARFDEAVAMAENSFAAEFQGLIQRLVERLQGLNDGSVKQFRDSTVENLHGFFDRFRALSIGSNDDLDRLIDDAKQAVEGIPPDWLRQSQALRETIHERLSVVQAELDCLMVARPKRAISFADE